MRDDEVDDLIRGALKTLDDQVSAGYFEDLPNRTLARLEDSSMNPSGTSDPSGATSAGVPPAADKPRDEDSGLHDIRALASTQRMRLSSRRVSTTPPVEDDVLASSSGSWKAVALPEPAKMVSLPELASLPSKIEVQEAQRAHEEQKQQKERKESKAERKSRKSGELAAAAAAAVATATEAPSPVEEAKQPAAATPVVGARLAAARPAKKGNRNAILGVAGLTLAAAAGVAIYVNMDRSADTATASEGAMAPEPTVQPIEDKGEAADTAAAPAAIAEPEVAPEPVQEEPAPEVAPEPPPVDPKPTKVRRAEKKARPKKVIEVPEPEKAAKKPDKPEETKPAPTKTGDPAQPSFEELLKEAGVSTTKAPKKPKLDRNSLSAKDFKKGMAPIESRALACYKGTQGMARLRLTIQPSGKIEKIVVSGQFAGKPEAACLEAAIRGATFPPWDGGPQSFGYSYLLAE